jgi:VWFA-related protein
MGSHRRIRIGVSLMSCWAVVAVATPLQTAPEPAPPVFRSDVALVTVPVFVTDKAGQAMGGLTAEDFEVEDGGRKVAIAAFQAVDVDDAFAMASSPELPVAMQAAVPRQFMLVFDLVFSPTRDLIRARAPALRFVRDSLGPTDLVAVATYGGAGFKMLTNFTTDREHVVRAIERLGLVGALGSDPLGLGDEIAGGGGEGAGGSGLDEQIAAQTDLLQQALRLAYAQKVDDFLVTLEELVQALSSLRGRKQLVLLSGGFSQTAWVGAQNERERFYRPRDMVSRDRMERLFRTAGRSDVVIHSINLAGLVGPVDVASHTGLAAGRGDGRESLAALATNTGGRFILPTNDLGLALREMEQVSRRYYLLGFQPEATARGQKARKLKVRVRRPGLSVSHRPEYVVPAAETASAPSADQRGIRLAAAEAIGKGLSGGPLGVQLTAIPYQDGLGRKSVPAMLHIDGAGLAKAARDERLDLQVYGYALVGGRILDGFSLETTLDLTKVGTSLRTDGVRVLTSFAVVADPVEIRFFARAGDGATGSIRRQVVMSESATPSAPVSLLPLPGRIVIPLSTSHGAALEIPFRLGGTAFIPGPVSLQSGRSRDLCVFVRRVDRGSGDRLEVTGEIARPGQAPWPVRVDGVRVVADPDTVDRYVLTVVPPEAALGVYILRLMFRDSATGRTVQTEAPMVLAE